MALSTSSAGGAQGWLCCARKERRGLFRPRPLVVRKDGYAAQEKKRRGLFRRDRGVFILTPGRSFCPAFRSVCVARFSFPQKKKIIHIVFSCTFEGRITSEITFDHTQQTRCVHRLPQTFQHHYIRDKFVTPPKSHPHFGVFVGARGCSVGDCIGRLPTALSLIIGEACRQFSNRR